MSQSPTTQVAEDEALRYRQGWRALNRLLHENRSFSGNEKHCAFLNCGPGPDGRQRRFADVSSAIGFDFPEDGRGLAFVDWDFDGDLDVWITNRTAPRVRFLRNGNESGNHFVAFQLQGNGTDTNRDAIGARLELHLRDAPAPQIKTLHAGHAFLSQSSRWLHFGLGKNPAIEKLVVRWPNGTREEVAGVQAGRFHLVAQGGGRATVWTPPPQRAALTPSEPKPLPATDLARIVVPPGMRLPTLWTVGSGGSPAPYQREGKGLLLVNLWASYCIPCNTELAEWSAFADKFRERDIEVVALNTDSLAGAENAREEARQAIEAARFPFAWAEADGLTVRVLDSFASAVLDLWKPLPVPSSFLVDARGEVVVMYKGPVHAEQVIADAALATATPEARRDAAVPFPGRWVEGPRPADSLRVASQLLDRDEVASAVRYLEDLVGSLTAGADDEDSKRDLGDARYFLAVLLEQGGDLPAARRQLEGARAVLPHDVRVRTSLANLYQQLGDYPLATAEITAAITINPSNLALHDQLGELHVRQDQFAKAVERYGMILQVDPKRAATRYQMAIAMLRNDQPAEAIAQFKQTLSTNPRLFDAANQLARVLASHPDQSLQAPQEALALATRLCEFTQNKDPRFLDTRATAAAANGQWTQAVASAEQALELYRADPRHAPFVKPLEERMALFRDRKAWVEAEWK